MSTAVIEAPRGEAAAPKRTADAAPASGAALPTHIARFDAKTRAMHIVVMTSFIGLATTGMPLLFSDARWAAALTTIFGGFRGAGIVHRFFGAALLALVVFHVGDVAWRAFVRREHGLLWGPTSMIPQPRDFVDFYRQMKWFVGLGPRPAFEHFTYWEKFDYWAVLWGTAIMGAAGLILWFPAAASRVLPGWMFNVALFVHGAEATLAIGFIFVVHFFNGHLRPGKFPMDLVIFTGSVATNELKEERTDEFRRLAAANALEASGRPAPSPEQVRRGYTVGTIGLVLGLSLFALIIYAVI